MPRSSSSFLFPDVNVWLALSYERHVHHATAKEWFEQIGPGARFCFCRFTQIGLLRLLTTDALMGSDRVLTQAEAWRVYDRWLEDDRILLVEEPRLMEALAAEAAFTQGLGRFLPGGLRGGGRLAIGHFRSRASW